MEKIICASCGATLTPNSSQPFLTCEYCDTTVPNAYYVQGEGVAAAAIDLPALCIEKLISMGEGEGLASVTDGCFGNPIQAAHAARDAMEIPSREKVYFVMDRSSILWSVEEGLALTDTGLYYKHDGAAGKMSWESFITGAIACTAGSSKQNPGTLSIGSGLSFSITTEEDARLARFLVDFHNQVYRQYTGESAPDSWAAAETCEQEEEGSSLTSTLGKVAMVAGALLGTRQRTVVPRSVVQRPAVQRSYRQQPPARPAMRREEPQRPQQRPMGQQPHRSRSEQPGGMFRPSGNHGGPGGRGGRGGHGGPGGMGGPGGRR